MNKQAIITVLITALTFVSCRPTARQTVADVAQPTDSTEAVTSADTLRLVITFAPVMLGQASAIKVRNQVSEYPPLSKLAGCPFYVPRYGLQRYEIFQPYRSKKFVMRLAFRMAEGYYYKKT